MKSPAFYREHRHHPENEFCYCKYLQMVSDDVEANEKTCEEGQSRLNDVLYGLQETPGLAKGESADQIYGAACICAELLQTLPTELQGVTTQHWAVHVCYARTRELVETLSEMVLENLKSRGFYN